MKIGLAIHGGNELAAKLNALPQGPKKVLLTSGRRAAEPIRLRASQLAPRAPGAPDLADNIGISSIATRRQDEVSYAIGPTKAFFYGFYQEYGTIHHGAQPFMRPAFQSAAPQALGLLGQMLWQEIRALAGQGVNLGGVGGRFG